MPYYCMKKLTVFKLGVLSILGYMLGNTKTQLDQEKFKTRKLERDIAHLEGQLENQENVIKGLTRTIERVSYINGKYINRKI